jgi:hypothetical protein
MAGLLKITCATGQTATLITSAVSALNGASSWTISIFYQFAVVPDPAAWSDFISISGAATVLTSQVRSGKLNLSIRDATGANFLTTAINVDTGGHHVLICGSPSDATIYLDGILNTHRSGIGPLLAGDSGLLIRWNDGGYGGVYWLKDLAIWGGYTASPSDVTNLATGAKTPSTMSPSPNATNYWTFQGPIGPVTANADDCGLIGGDFTGQWSRDSERHPSFPRPRRLLSLLRRDGQSDRIATYLNPLVRLAPALPTTILSFPYSG